MPVAMERPRRLPVSAIAYRTQFQDVKMAACFMIKNPKDAPIYVTGLSASNSWPYARTPSEGPTQMVAAPGPVIHRRNSDKSPPGSRAGRYCPALAVTRRSLPIPNKPTYTEDVLKLSAGAAENTELTSSADVLKNDVRENSSKRQEPWTPARPVPPSGILKSRSDFFPADAAAKSRSSLDFLTRSKVNLRTGFMRSLSRPTPGEMDLKYHRDSQENSRRGRRERDEQPDLDRLNMSVIMRMLKSRSAVEKRVSFQGADASNVHCQNTLDADDTVSDGANGMTDRPLGNSCSPKADVKGSQNGHAIISCEPPLVSSKYRNRDHKLRLQALYSQYHQFEGRENRSANADRTSKHDRNSDHKKSKVVTDKKAQMLSHPDDKKRVRVSFLSLESFGEDGDATGADFRTGSSGSSSDYSNGSGSGERGTPRSTAALLLQQHLKGDQQRQFCQMCKGSKSGKHTRTTRRVRYDEAIHSPSLDRDDRHGRARQAAGRDLATENGTAGDLEPHHHRVSFAEFISIAHPMRPPANSPVSVISEDEDDLLSLGNQDTDHWSVSYNMKGATTAASSISGLVKGQVKVESDGGNRATINIFLPQMT